MRTSNGVLLIYRGDFTITPIFYQIRRQVVTSSYRFSGSGYMLTDTIKIKDGDYIVIDEIYAKALI